MGQKKRESTTSKRRLLALERQKRALDLRIAGWHYTAIARELGYSGSPGAVQAVDAAILRTLREPADTVRRMELARLDALWAAIWPAASTGDLGAIKRALEIMERRAKYLGLDVPALRVMTPQDEESAAPAAAMAMAGVTIHIDAPRTPSVIDVESTRIEEQRE